VGLRGPQGDELALDGTADLGRQHPVVPPDRAVVVAGAHQAVALQQR
jgi:hypothetical protein